MRRPTALVLALPLLGALAAPTAAAATLPACPTSGPPVCFTAESHTPEVTVPAGTADTTYADFRATVRNSGTSTVTHFSITDLPFPGASIRTISGATSSGGTASCSAATGVCRYGKLASGTSVTVDVVLAIAPAAAAGTSGVNRFTLSLDEGTNDNPANPGGKTDYASIDTSVTLLARDGRSVVSYVPAGTAATLTTDRNGKPFAAATSDANGNEVGTTQIPAVLTQSVLASVRRSATGVCPGTCAMSDWLEVSVPGFSDATPAGAVLRTTLRVDSTLVDRVKGLTPNSVVVWYQPDLAASARPLARCSASLTSDCFTAQKEKDGDLAVVVIEPHNGRMRL